MRICLRDLFFIFFERNVVSWQQKREKKKKWNAFANKVEKYHELIYQKAIIS